jgi:SAM-dependent methyltransferase
VKRPLRAALEQAFADADVEHFSWQTRCPYVSERERELVRAAFEPLGERVVDLGCGEGATLAHLGAPEGAVGVDLFEAKVRFAASRLPRCRFLAASVEALPFDGASFDHVLVRDVLHHLDEPERLIAEAWRILAAGGRIDVLEPCVLNPLVAAHGLLVPAERGELRSTPHFVERTVARRFRVEGVRRYQALPLYRVAFHPTLGSPRLAGHALARRVVGAAERLAERLMPRAMFSYVHVRANKA